MTTEKFNHRNNAIISKKRKILVRKILRLIHWKKGRLEGGEKNLISVSIKGIIYGDFFPFIFYEE
jgi:hypothetical protein